MEIIIKFTDKDDDGNWEMEKAKRTLHTDDAFGLIFNLSEKLRARLKYEEKITDEEYKFLEELRDDIFETRLLEYYN